MDFIHTRDGAIDCSTGEIVLYTYSKPDYIKEVIVTRHFYEARDVEELHEIVKRYGERRYSNVVYNLNKERLCKWYLPILNLCSKVGYFNVGFYDRDYLCSVFDVTESNLNKLLNKIVKMGIFKYTGKGLAGQVRIIWNPMSVWKGWENSKTRVVCIQEWYKNSYRYVDDDSECAVERSETPLVFDDPIITKSPPDPYVSPYYNVENKDRFRLLMDVSDAEFELILLNIKRDKTGKVIPVLHRKVTPTKAILLKEDFMACVS